MRPLHEDLPFAPKREQPPPVVVFFQDERGLSEALRG